MAQQTAPKTGDMAGMSHSEVHYFNSYNHHGIHEEMLVQPGLTALHIREWHTNVRLVERRSPDQELPRCDLQ